MFDDGILQLRHQINQAEHDEINRRINICLELNLASELQKVINETKADFETLREGYRVRGIMI